MEMIDLVLAYLWLWLKLWKHSLTLPRQNTGIINSKGIRLDGGKKKTYHPNIQAFLWPFPFTKYSVLLPTPSPLHSPQILCIYNFFKKNASKTLHILLVQLLGKWSGECISYLN